MRCTQSWLPPCRRQSSRCMTPRKRRVKRCLMLSIRRVRALWAAGSARRPYAAKLVDAVLENAHGTVVLDADALNILAKTPEKLLVPQAPVIITPHPGEMCHLNGRTMAELRADRLQTARAFAQTYRVITVLKGAGTIIAAPSGETRVNTTATPAWQRRQRRCFGRHHKCAVRAEYAAV